MNSILRQRKATTPPISPIPRERPGYHGDNIARGLPSARFLNPGHILIPPGSRGLLGLRLLLGRADVQNRPAKTGRLHPSLSRLDGGDKIPYPGDTL